MKRKYNIAEKWTGNYNEIILFEGQIELDDTVIANVDDSWRKLFYDYTKPSEIAAHIAFNMIVNNLPLSRIDGFANLSDDMAMVLKQLKATVWQDPLQSLEP